MDYIADLQVFLVSAVDGSESVRDGREMDFIDEYLPGDPRPEAVHFAHKQRGFGADEERQARNLGGRRVNGRLCLGHLMSEFQMII